MLRLRMLGGLAVAADDQPVTGAATQRRRLALLALVAMAGEGGISRDKLIAYLWPESEPEGARHALTQSLYALRRDLRAPNLLDGGTTEVRLNPQLITTDVADFRAAVRTGDLDAAIGHYGGPFLDGFFITEAPEFERWVDGERADLAKAAEHALETLASDATARGQLRRAADWWRRLATLDPLNTRVALGYMNALAAAGDRAAALRYARVHEAMLQEEFQVPPHPDVLALVQRLREERAPATPAAGAGAVAAASVAVAPAVVSGTPPTVADVPGGASAERYRVEREIGRGRLATVFLAHDVRHGRPVALKVLHREVAAMLDVTRFTRELLLLARLRHPNILPLYDSGQAGDVLYYVTPYVEAGSLRARIERSGPLPVDEALDYAHRHNTVHRAVTPEHVLLEDGHVLVGGFGIARAINSAFEVRLTEPGHALGAPPYMSPEQMQAVEPLDGRSDIYSAGCVLYEMLTGAPPSADGGAAAALP
ncbi:MAG: protein kinase domain-containing protein, partial [Gemmatirosa sp.]